MKHFAIYVHYTTKIKTFKKIDRLSLAKFTEGDGITLFFFPFPTLLSLESWNEEYVACFKIYLDEKRSYQVTDSIWPLVYWDVLLNPLLLFP